MPNEVRINFAFFIGLNWVLYGFLPMLEKSLKGTVNNLDFGFLIDVNIAIGMMIIGVFYADIAVKSIKLRNKKNVYAKEEKKERPLFSLKNEKMTILFSSIFVGTIFINYIFRIYGGFGALFTQQYGTANSSSFNSLSVTIPLLSVAYILLFNSKWVRLSRLSNFLVSLMSFLMIGVFMLGGLRNLGVMMSIAYVWSKFFGKIIKVKFMLLGVVSIIVFAAVVAVGREYGLLNFLLFNVDIPREDISRYILAISEGEFGTMRRVHEYSHAISYEPKYIFGYSYTIGTIVNMIPGSLYPSRPFSIAVDFTRAYWGGLTNGTIGLGFSPILEAKLNFQNFWGIAFVFGGIINRLIHYKFIRYISSYKMVSFNWFLFIGVLSSISLNFFRIDFAVTIKFLLIIYVFALILKKIFLDLIVIE